MKLAKITLIAVAIFMSSIGYATDPKAVVTEKNQDIIIVNSKSPEFKITLSRNATTGYSWILKNPEMYMFVQQLDYEYQRSDNKLIGGGGQDIWQFQVRKEYFKAPITFQLHFIYVQPWELNVAQEKVFNIIVMPNN